MLPVTFNWCGDAFFPEIKRKGEPVKDNTQIT
jgi:hypothetical protein